VARPVQRREGPHLRQFALLDSEELPVVQAHELCSFPDPDTDHVCIACCSTRSLSTPMLSLRTTLARSPLSCPTKAAPLPTVLPFAQCLRQLPQRPMDA
jgi:hypothetical protein